MTIRNLATLLCCAWVMSAQAYKLGDQPANFRLQNVDGSWVSLADLETAKGVVVVFTGNRCAAAQAYEDRIIALAAFCEVRGWKLLAINPNDPAQSPDDSYQAMQRRARERSYAFPYCVDETQEVARAFGVSRTPTVYALRNNGSAFEVGYIGAIDDNADDAEHVRTKYAEVAIAALDQHATPDPPMTRAIGCSIKWKAP